MSSQSVVSVCNVALLSIGAQAQISNLQEGSTEADACNTLFQFIFEMVARAALWNCLRNQKTLSLIQAALGTPENTSGQYPLPPSPWLYAYALPSDCLRARFILPPNNSPSTGIPFTPATQMANADYGVIDSQIPFKVAYSVDANNNPIQVILTNESQAQLVYTVNQPNPQIWDSAFTSCIVASLAAWLVPALSLNRGLMSDAKNTANSLVMSARVDDANEGSTTQDHIPDWIRVRTIGGGFGYSGSVVSAEGYGNLSWPG